MSQIFRDSESSGKSAGNSGLGIEHFCWEVVLNCCVKKFFFFADYALQNMMETMLPNGLETSGQRVYRLFWHISRRI